MLDDDLGGQMTNENRQPTRFDTKQLQHMVAVGEVGSDYARIWMRSDSRGEIQVTYREFDNYSSEERIVVQPTGQITDHSQSVRIEGLKPLTSYRYRVVSLGDHTHIGSGSFRTFPEKPEDTPRKVAIALMSCHQPFDPDTHDVSERRMRLLRVTENILEDNDVRFILLAGDQIYSDVPDERSLFSAHYTKRWGNADGESILDWNSDDIRKAYQERYRIFWRMTEVQHFYANYPCYPILDDHEIVDDWGSDKSHRKRRWMNVRNGAREAYYDYQGSRIEERRSNLPPSLHYEFEYGDIGVFVLDIRSQRRAEKNGSPARIYGEPQLRDFKSFLEKNEDKSVLLIMSSVPLIHMPEWIANVGAAIFKGIDFPDHWTYGPNKPSLERLMKLIYSHQKRNPKQRVLIVSGDVHIGCAFAIEWKGDGPQPILYQFTSSAISNRMKAPKTEFSKTAPQQALRIDCGDGLTAKTRLLQPENDGENPFAGLNLGIIEIHKNNDESQIKLRLVSYPEGKEDEYCDVFSSSML